MKSKLFMLFTLSILMLILSACSTQNNGVYKMGEVSEDELNEITYLFDDGFFYWVHLSDVNSEDGLVLDLVFTDYSQKTIKLRINEIKFGDKSIYLKSEFEVDSAKSEKIRVVIDNETLKEKDINLSDLEYINVLTYQNDYDLEGNYNDVLMEREFSVPLK